MKYDVPFLEIDDLKGYINPAHYSPSEVIEVLANNNWKSLGWLNSGIQLPYDVPFEQIYSNRSGSYTIMGNFDAQLYYCVDMGD